MVGRRASGDGELRDEKPGLGFSEGVVHPLLGQLRPALVFLMQAAVSRVKDPAPESHQNLERLGDARARQVLQRPVPVVIVVHAELIVASHQFVVELSVDAHSYVVFGRHPARRLRSGGELAEVRRALVVAQRQDVAVRAVDLPEFHHSVEEVMKVWEKVVVLLDEHHEPFVAPKNLDALEDEVQLPPPVMFGLGDGRFPVVSVRVRVLGVQAAHPESVRFRHVPRTISGVLSREFTGIQLRAVGEEHLQNFTEGDVLHHLRQLLGEVVVTEYDERFFYVLHLFQRADEHVKVSRSVVHLHRDHHLRLRREALCVLNQLFVVAVIHRSTHTNDGAVVELGRLRDPLHAPDTFAREHDIKQR